MTGLEEHRATTTRETAVIADIKIETPPQPPTTVSGGAPAPRGPLAIAFKIEAETNVFLAEMASLVKPEEPLRLARINLNTKAIRPASSAKLYDERTFMQADWEEGSGDAELSGWEARHLREVTHPMLKMLSHSNPLESCDVALLLHVFYGAEVCFCASAVSPK